MTYKEWVDNFDKPYICDWYTSYFISNFHKIQNQERFYNSKVWTRCSSIETKKLVFYDCDIKISSLSLDEIKELYSMNVKIWKYEKLQKKLDRLKEDFEIRT
jgi:hypothetical protein